MSTPGHKQRQDLTGTVVAGDAPLYGGLDTIKHADRLLADAEARAAALWGADWCRFSVAGSTHGNQAFCLALGQPGQEVIITRTVHRSLLLGLVLAGLRPVWVRPDIDQRSGLPAAVPVQTVRDALAAHPAACGVILGDPSYVGTTGDLAGHARAAHEAGVPLIVDSAWAAYLGFHPDLPPHAIAAGADGLVTSAHKTLPAYTQGALMLARTDRLDVARLNRAFEATHTTSPAGSIVASIDATRALLARDGSGAVRPAAARRGRRPAAAARGAGRGGARRPRRRPGQARGAAGRYRGERQPGRGRPDRRGHAGGDGRPGHPHPHPVDRRRRGAARGVHRDPDRLDRAPPRRAAPAGRRGRLDGAAADGPVAPGGILRPERDRHRRRGDRPGQRGTGRALPARRPGPGPGRAHHRRRASRAARGGGRRRPDRLRG